MRREAWVYSALRTMVEEKDTVGTIVQGGAIALLIDTAAMVAAWSGATLPAKVRSTTVRPTVAYLAAANRRDLQATARVVRCGRGDSSMHFSGGVGGRGRLARSGEHGPETAKAEQALLYGNREAGGVFLD